MFLILVYIYFISLVTAASAACWFVIRKNSRKADQPSKISNNIDRSFNFLSLYYLSNLLTECILWIIRPFPNHFILSISIMFSVSFILLFFLLQSQSKKFLWLIIVVFGYILYLFFTQRLWHPTSLVTFSFFVSYYSCIAIVSSVFLSVSLLNHHRLANQFNINISILFFTYHFVSLFISVFRTITHSNEIEFFMTQLNLCVCILFYSFSSLLIYRMIKTQSNDR